MAWTSAELLAAERVARALGAVEQRTLNLGLALLRLQRWGDAAQAFRETLRRQPDNQVALSHLLTLQPDPAARARVLRIAMR